MSVDLRSATEEDIDRLDIEERKKLFFMIARSLQIMDAPTLTPEQEAYLDELLEEHDAHPDEGRPWREVMDEIQARCLKS